MRKQPQPVAIAVGAHPDDIEFGMAGTLLLLRRAGWTTHYFNVANGSCGSRRLPPAELVRRRGAEARAAAGLLGCTWHASLVPDLEIFYEAKLLRRVAAVLRAVHPTIVLTHSPQDYMEDHVNTCRLVVTAAFSLGMSNFRTVPRRPAVSGDVFVYHALPHGLRDGLRHRLQAGAWVDTTSVHELKTAALAAHRSQQDWLEASQGMNSYVRAMDDLSRAVGRASGCFTHAEGWRRHLHLGFSAEDGDPLASVLGARYRINPQYELSLETDHPSTQESSHATTS